MTTINCKVKYIRPLYNNLQEWMKQTLDSSSASFPDFLNRNKLDSLMCVYCLGHVSDTIDYSRTQICVPCNEYKSVTTVREYLTEYEGLVNA